MHVRKTVRVKNSTPQVTPKSKEKRIDYKVATDKIIRRSATLLTNKNHVGYSPKYMALA
jgi:hypothetical protein